MQAKKIFSFLFVILLSLNLSITSFAAALPEEGYTINFPYEYPVPLMILNGITSLTMTIWLLLAKFRIPCCAK